LNYKQYLVEVGTGIDLHGEDETKAAQRAVKDAISHSSMVGLTQIFKVKNFSEIEDSLMVDVTVACPNPDKLNREEVLSILPEGRRRIRVVKGGIRVPDASTIEETRTHPIVVVNAVIVVLVDFDKIQRR
jgi:uncharacterized protein (TIGR02058 family)